MTTGNEIVIEASDEDDEDDGYKREEFKTYTMNKKKQEPVIEGKTDSFNRKQSNKNIVIDTL
jgi:hypothetical protein